MFHLLFLVYRLDLLRASGNGDRQEKLKGAIPPVLGVQQCL